MDMDSTQISSIAELQAPALMRTDSLVYNLRLCTYYATTREAAGIRLAGSDFNRFASGLTLLANNGLDVLVDANGFLTELRYTAHAMADPTGTLSSLIKNVGNPDRARSFDRMLTRLQDQVNDCDSCCEKLKDRFQEWRNRVDHLKLDVQANLGDEKLRGQEIEDQVADHERSVASALQELRFYRDEEKHAQQKHEAVLKRSRLLSDSTPQSPGESDLHITYSPVDPVPVRVSLSIYSLLQSSAKIVYSMLESKAAAKALKDTQEEVDRRREEAIVYERQLDEAKQALKSLEFKKNKLENFMQGLEKTLRALELVTDDVRAIVLDFGEMRTVMKQLLNSNKRELQSTADATIEENPDEGDIEDFVTSARKMQKFALTIEHLAWLYAGVIKDVMMSGFQIDRTAGAANSSSQAPIHDIAHVRNQSSQMYLLEAGSSTTTISSKVDQAYQESYQRIQQASGRETRMITSGSGEKEASVGQSLDEPRPRGQGKLKRFFSRS